MTPHIAISIVVVALIGASIWFIAANSTLFLNSRIDRLFEKNLPRITIENDGMVYYRMKADDFRFNLPNSGIAIDPQIKSGGFDTVKGSVRVRFQDDTGISASDYQELIYDQLQTGGWITVKNDQSSSDLILEFGYFGDR